MTEQTLTQASKNWMTRPSDQRYLTLDALQATVDHRRVRSRELVTPLSELPLVYTPEGDVALSRAPGRSASLTNYAFGKLAAELGAPAGYLRTLPAPLAVMNLSWGLKAAEGDTKVLSSFAGDGDDSQIRTFTSPGYGRIWDSQVVQQIQDLNHDGRWEIPAASYASRNPKQATTLYASDHDVFAFLVDPNHPIEVAGDTLFRGFMAWNSETGARSFGLCTFLYRYVCDNRLIWGAAEVSKLIIRHTSGGPTRFAQEAAPALKAYSEGSTRAIEATIREAQDKRVAKDVPAVEAWLREKGFTREVAKVSVALAEQEERDPTSLWSVVQGLTAYARTIEHTDTRTDMERAAGRLLTEVGS